MKEVVASGRTVEDAKQEAMRELGVESLKDVEVEVIDEGSKGVFGWGTKYARVRVRLLEESKIAERKAKEEVIPPTPSKMIIPEPTERRRNNFLEPTGAPVIPPGTNDYMPPPPARDYKPTPPPREYKAAPPAREYKPAPPAREYKPAAPARDYKPAAPARDYKPATPAREYKAPPPRQREHKAPPPPPKEYKAPPPPPEIKSEPEIEPTGPFAPRTIITELMSLMNLEAEIVKSRSNGNDMYSISGKELGVLIGKHGQTLEALQFIINLILLRKTDAKKKITIDVEGYRARREKSLKDLAKRIAEKAKRERRKVVLEPMLPSERRIIHLTLQKNPYVSTYSQGEEPMRRVVISPKRHGGR